MLDGASLAQVSDGDGARARLQRCLEFERTGERNAALRVCRAARRAGDASDEEVRAARNAEWRLRSHRPRYGPVAGLRLTTMSGDPRESYDPRLGFSLGAAGTLPLGCYVALVGELAVAKKGTFAHNELDERVNVDLVYLDLPVMLRVGVERPAAVIPHAFAGVLGSMLLSAEGQAEGHPQADLADLSDPFSFALVVGAGSRFPTDAGDITADVRYEHGMNGVITANVLHYEATSSSELRHRILSLNGGFLF